MLQLQLPAVMHPNAGIGRLEPFKLLCTVQPKASASGHLSARKLCHAAVGCALLARCKLRRRQNTSLRCTGKVSKNMRVVIVPGNGVESDVRRSNWYGWLEAELLSAGVGGVGLSVMPDPVLAREENWLPFIVDHLAGGADLLPSTVIVGHSSGAAAAMRLAEKHRLAGMVLVSAYKSDMGYPSERASGYFSRPWQWHTQQNNCSWIVQFASTDDPFLPLESEQRAVRDALFPKVEYYELEGRSHFFEPFGEVLQVLKAKLNL